MSDHRLDRRRLGPVSRRRFLRAGASLAVGLPWLASLSEPRAAHDGFAHRLVFIFGTNGVVEDDWFPAQAGPDFVLPFSSAPLDPFRDRLVIYQGLQNRAARIQGGSPHTKAGSSTLTGAAHIEGQFELGGGGGFSTRSSIDQELAPLIGGGTPIGTLLTGIDIGLGASGETPRSRLSYAGYNQPVEPIGSASQIFAQLSGFLGGGGPQANAEIMRLRDQRRSVLDLAMGDIEALDGSLSAVDRARLDHHLTHLRQLEQSIGALPSPDEADPACIWLDEPGPVTHVTERTRQMLDLIAFALRCDITRIATFQWSGCQSAINYGFLPNTPDYAHHALSHVAGPEYYHGMREIARYHCEQVAYFADLLDQTPEGERTLLDHTIVVHLNTMNYGETHTLQNLPVSTIGGTGLLAGGQVLSYPDRTLNDFHITLAQALGVPMTTFGDAEHVTGPLTAALV
jgi:hypothetical protein